MIAVSSFRPHTDKVYASNQMRARESWQNVFQEVHYFGEPEADLNMDGTKFLGSDWPSIRAMASHASTLNSEYVAIINADIVVDPKICRVVGTMLSRGIPAATSYRYEFDPSDPFILKDRLIRNKADRGMDIFIASPHIWQAVAMAVPGYLRIGHQTWDTWVCGFFCARLGYGFQQFTDEKVIFHPRHDGRKTPYSEEIKNNDPHFTLAHVPSKMEVDQI